MKISLTTLISVGLFLIFPVLFLNAQNNNINSLTSISISPQAPAPATQAKVSLQSFSSDLNRAKITWFIDGQEKRTEIGLKDFYIQAGRAGRLMTVGAKVEFLDGSIDNREVSFIPAGVDLLFEAISYTPPFYKGKALNIKQGTVVVVAFPELFDENGRKYSTKELIYNWRSGGLVVASASGIGKNYFTYTGSIPVRDAEIEVSVSSLDQKVVANNSINITTTDPKIVFYENSPIYGIMMNRAIKSSVNMLIDEFSVVAVPYFFSAGYANTPDLDYTWSLNGQKVETQDQKNIFTTRIEKGAGTANIGLKISNNVRFFQYTDNNYLINFEKQ
ncbi:MAG: hypothetical protein WC027_00815 [Candidatus Paceibacterota bacterium]